VAIRFDYIKYFEPVCKMSWIAFWNGYLKWTTWSGRILKPILSPENLKVNRGI
jgi:hypothetical protein